MPKKSPQVFCSYTHTDYPQVSRLVRDLESEGINVWIDRQSLHPGEAWGQTISEAIQKSDFLLVCVSQNTGKSSNVQQEVLHAFQGIGSQDRRIIPIILEGAETQDIPQFLAHLQWIDFRESYLTGIRTLVAALRRTDNKRKPVPKHGLDIDELSEQIANAVKKRLGLEAVPEHVPVPPTSDSKLVFVITAFRPDLEPVFKGIEAAAIAVGLSAKRVKDVQGDYRITDKIIDMIQKARFVVVDLTYERPNVYFELGYARGVGKRVITVARAGTDVHFDVKDWTYLPYQDSRTLEEDLKRRFAYELSPNDGEMA